MTGPAPAGAGLKTPEDDDVNIDLLETRLNALEAAQHEGLIDERTRQTIVLSLLEHIDAVCAMQFLVRDIHDGLMHAVEIGYTDAAPELHVQIQDGTLEAWRAFLAARVFSDLGSGPTGFGFSGPCIVRLTYRRIHLHQTLPAEEVAA